MKNKLNPFIVALVVLVVWDLILDVGPILQHGGNQSLDEMVSRTISIPLVLAPILLLVVVSVTGWRREVGLKPIESARSLLILWLPLLFVLVFVVGALAGGLSFTQATAFVLINTILVGFSEELMFRGVLFYGALTQFRVWTAIIITSLLFGAVHITNGFITGDFTAAMIQAIAAAMAGIWFMAIRVRTKSIIPGMIMHALWDCAIFLSTSAIKGDAAQPSSAPAQTSFVAQFAAPVLFALPLFLYGLWLLRGVGNKTKEEILS